VTEVDGAIDLYDDKYTPISKEDERTRDNYDGEKYHGTPVGLQIVGRRLEEEKMLAIAQMFEDAIHNVAI